MEDLERAVSYLQAHDCTCVLVKGDTVYGSTRRGIAPLMELLQAGRDCRGFSAADKVVGRATAFLYGRMGVVRLHTHTISKSAAEVLEGFGIVYSFDQMVEAILNRKKDGFCPMESAVRRVSDPEEAYRILVQAYAKLND